MYKNLSNDAIFLKYEKWIREYMDSRDTFIYKLSEIWEAINNGSSLPFISRATFYRYIDKMHIKRYSHPSDNQKYFFAINTNADDCSENTLDFCIKYQKYNKTLYATVAENYGILLAALLNQKLKRSIFYSTFYQGLLTCYYYYKKDEDTAKIGKIYLDSKYIKKQIKSIIDNISYNKD